MTHIMLDIETLGTRPGCVVMSVALVRFADLASVSINLDIQQQIAAGLTVDPQTHQWWGTQDPAAWAAATANPYPLDVALPYLADWINTAVGPDALVWCHGASFDAPILGEVYRLTGRATPWNFRNVRDTRTLYDLAGVALEKPATGLHIALNDALAQTRTAVEALRVLAGVRGLVAA